MSNEEKQMLDRVLAEHRYDPSSVIAVMQAVQKTYRYLPQEMLSYIDILIDGPFLPEEKDISLQFRGSRNQRIIDMDRTRRSGQIALWSKLRR